VNVLLIYGYHPGTTGWYFERVLARGHKVMYGGPAYRLERPGLAPDLDLARAMAGCRPRPDLILYVDSPGPFFPRGLERVDAPTAAYLIDVHTQTAHHLELATLFDYVFIAQKDYLDSFRKANPHSYWLPFGCDPEIHRNLATERIFDVGFVGHLTIDRRKILERLARHFRVNDYDRTCPPEEMAEIYSRSRIVFNRPVRRDLNMRVFEALACGSLLITERIGNGQDELFADRKHLVTYQEAGELEDLVANYLKQEREREEIAACGHARVVERDTYELRVRELLRVTTKGEGEAPARNEAASRVAARYVDIYCRKGMLDSALAMARKLSPFRPASVVAAARLAKTSLARCL
jgi:hypothetical protein